MTSKENSQNKPVVYIHIGTNKTGTTAIQQFLYANQKPLADVGVIYPDFKRPGSHMFASYFGFGNRKFITRLNEKHTEDDLKRILEVEVLKPLQNKKDVILSSEAFTITRKKIGVDKYSSLLVPVRKFLDGFNVKIICYIRRQDSYIESSYNQATKKKITRVNIEEFIQKRNLNWYILLSVFAHVFGKENLIVRPYERHRFYNQNVLYDILNVIGVNDYSKFKFPDNDLNSKLSDDLMTIISCYGLNDTSGIWDLIMKVKHHKGLKTPVLRSEVRREIIEYYEASNQKVLNEFLPDETGQLFTAPIPDLDEEYEPYQGLKIQKLIPVVLEVLKYQNDQAETILQNYKSIEKIID